MVMVLFVAHTTSGNSRHSTWRPAIGTFHEIDLVFDHPIDYSQQQLVATDPLLGWGHTPKFPQEVLPYCRERNRPSINLDGKVFGAWHRMKRAMHRPVNQMLTHPLNPGQIDRIKTRINSLSPPHSLCNGRTLWW